MDSPRVGGYLRATQYNWPHFFCPAACVDQPCPMKKPHKPLKPMVSSSLGLWFVYQGRLFCVCLIYVVPKRLSSSAWFTKNKGSSRGLSLRGGMLCFNLCLVVTCYYSLHWQNSVLQSPLHTVVNILRIYKVLVKRSMAAEETV